jgi:carbohydrate diacid regulator
MNISRQNAMQIVFDISNIINQHINMIDENGLIIASTNPERIGTFHEAAFHIINENLDSFIIHENYEFNGSLKGLNLPILFDNIIVGVIGITGDYKDIGKYGQIVKKMAEILILKNYLQEQEKIDDHIKTRFLDEWLFEDTPEGYNKELIDNGNRFGIDITIPRRVLIAEMSNISKYNDNPEYQRLIDRISRMTRRIVERGNQNVFMKKPSQMICLLTDRDDAQMRAITEEIFEQAKKQFNVDVCFGIDKKSARPYQAYQRAKKALTAGRYVNESIYFYDDITVEIFMDEISDVSRKEFLMRIFRGFDVEEIAYWINFLKVYFTNDGSLEETSSALYIHKNTVQNKLAKLAGRTGYDPRKLMDAALFVLAIQFYENAAQQIDLSK